MTAAVYTLYRVEGRHGYVPILQAVDPQAVRREISRLPSGARFVVFDHEMNNRREFQEAA